MNFKDYTTCKLESKYGSLTYRAYCGIPYVKNPVSDLQVLHIYVPESYFCGGSVGKYTAATAPVFFPNGVGGYMESMPCSVTVDENGVPDGQAAALLHGYVVISAGARGKTTANKEGKYIGKAPADIVDLKAAVRFIKNLPADFPGNKQRIISNGTSAGGAMSALLGTTGDTPEYEPYLQELGAYPGSDAVFASSCYCPIINLENADTAYEWQYGDLEESHHWGGLVKHTAKQMEYSADLRKLFPAYVNSLKLVSAGKALTMEENGSGSFTEYVKALVIESAREVAAYGIAIPQEAGINLCAGNMDFAKYNAYITRLKPPIAFDSQVLHTAENELFGDEQVHTKHFTAYGISASAAEMANGKQIALMNPMNFVNNPNGAKHFRIRHGAADRDTSFAISAMFACKLLECGKNVDYKLPWGIPHSGNYDLQELFAWIDSIV